jgi:hypothetical protein
MALSILDGNQSATTLSTIVTSGQHITAHTVVSLGTQAVADITTAISGTSVCVGNLGLLQSTVATEGLSASGSFIKIGGHTGTSTTGNIVHVSAIGALRVDGSSFTQPVSIASVTIGNTVTIAGTVTANPTGTQTIAGTVTANVQPQQSDDTDPNIKFIPIGYATVDGGGQLDQWTAVDPLSPLPVYFPSNNPLPAGTNRIGVVTIGGGTVTIGAGTAQIGVVTIGNIRRSTDGATTQLTTEVGSGYLEVRSYIGAGTAQIGSVTASISGTVPISISSVTVGNSVTIASLPAISGTVTANLAISSSAITSGSFTSLASATLVPANTARKMATVYNLGAGQLFINAGASATTLGGGFMVALSSGDYFECPFTTTTLSAIFATAGTASWVSH